MILCHIWNYILPYLLNILRKSQMYTIIYNVYSVLTCGQAEANNIVIYSVPTALKLEPAVIN